MTRTVHGMPPWEGSPTPPLEVFEQHLAAEPDLIRVLSRGHLANLLLMALDERNRWATAAAELADVAARDQVRRESKRDYQRDYREGLRGGRAARAAMRAKL